MPRNVRNFWIEAEVDGHKTPIKFGPTGKDGGFRLTVFMRNKGGVEEVVRMAGYVSSATGRLILWADREDGKTGNIDIVRDR